MPDSNRSQSPAMAPHGIYAAAGENEWIAIACRNDSDWRRLAEIVDEAWTREPHLATKAGRLAHEDELDDRLTRFTGLHAKHELAARLCQAGVPAAAVKQPRERIDEDANTREWGLWPTVEHSNIGKLRVDGLPVHLSETDWELTRGAACLGEHNDFVYGEILGLTAGEIDDLREQAVI
jgi:crotonobetainyl-CoA:carnitine CoA-transferase CaiB-like acyl-CoA transferase